MRHVELPRAWWYAPRGPSGNETRNEDRRWNDPNGRSGYYAPHTTIHKTKALPPSAGVLFLLTLDLDIIDRACVDISIIDAIGAAVITAITRRSA